MKRSGRALIVSTVGRQFFLFEQANISALRRLGYSVEGAADLTEDQGSRLEAVGILLHQIDFRRRPLSPSNLKAMVQLFRLIQSRKYEVVHCHSPVGGAVGRLAAWLADTKIIVYTAHGFHFFRGAPRLSWFFYAPIEKALASISDCVITINREDFEFAKNHFSTKAALIEGVGVDLSRFEYDPAIRLSRRHELQLRDDEILVISVGELNEGKGHEITIEALALLRPRWPLRLVILGRGDSMQSLVTLTRTLGVERHVDFLGYVDDVVSMLAAADIFVSSSRREGLPVSVIEAMAAGLPLVCSDVRGNRDLVREGQNGWLVQAGSSVALAEGLEKTIQHHEEAKRMGTSSLGFSKRYGLDEVEKSMMTIYSSLEQGTKTPRRKRQESHSRKGRRVSFR